MGSQRLSDIEDISQRRRNQAELAAPRPGRTAPPDIEVIAYSAWPGTDPKVRVRVYRPAGSGAPSPCLYYIHGDGLVPGSAGSDDAKASWLAQAVGCVVVSAEYRLAPENPYPAAVDDRFAGLRWLAGSPHELGIDPDRIALHGSSAGGCLAAATALLARDRGGPAIAHLMLISPMLDDRCPTASHGTNTGFRAWSRGANIQAWQAYLGKVFGTDRVPAYAAPARADDLAGLPPTYVDVGDLDLFRDEAVDFAHRMMRAGVPVELHVHPGGIHGGETLAPEADLSARVRSYRLGALRRALFAQPSGRPSPSAQWSG
ncbi:alpha/beta hydrolase [Streptomyces fagopyri]|uniref:alpha/beta hydrolase n=1 Tax=Streptomyces fagopyri TaxID=2662397 RepID=UPI001D174F01|nr:alpha/beta hydrolase [Streptomyces fagopyri]